jgi:hypothetical protein
MKRWLKRTLVAVVACLALRTVWLVGEREWKRAAGEREYAAAVAETEKSDPNWRWEALAANRQQPPADKNGATLIPRIGEATPKDWGQKLHDPEWEPILTRPANLRLPDEVVAEARRELGAAGRAVEFARAFKDYPSGHREITLSRDVLGTLLPDTQHTRAAAALLRWSAVVAVEDGDPGRAADDLAAALNVSRSIGDEPFLISQLVRMATRTVAARSTERALAQLSLPADRLASLQAAWAADAEEPLLLYGVRGERAAWDVLMARLGDGTVTLNDIAGTKEEGLSFGTFAWWLYRCRVSRNRAFALRWYGEAVAAARLPVHEQAPIIRSLRGKLPDPGDKDYVLARLLLPAVDKVAEGGWRAAAEARCVAVGLVCERFRLAHGRWPESLSAVPADLLPGGVPFDPFDGQPLRYRRLDDGAVVYSVGPDGKDDGGALDRQVMPGAPDSDIGFRLWDPAHRRKPAPPAAPPMPEPETPP